MSSEGAESREPRRAQRTRDSSRQTSRPSHSGAGADPGLTQDESDPGDEMQRRLRYQHAYGVILLIGCATKKLPYGAIWCEHHDDFLARSNGQYDSFQVKTSLPERGAWDTRKEPFVHSVGKFVQQDEKFPGRMRGFRFVSNTSFFDTSDARRQPPAGQPPYVVRIYGEIGVVRPVSRCGFERGIYRERYVHAGVKSPKAHATRAAEEVDANHRADGEPPVLARQWS